MRLYRADSDVVMSQYFVDHIVTVATPCADGLLGVMPAWMSTPYGVLFVNFRSTVGQATVASRPDRVAVDVERVRLVLDVLEAGEEGGVEGRRGRLRDAAAVVLLEDAVLDDEALHEAVLGVRSPTVSLRENVSPGFSTVPLMSSMARPMLVLR